MRASIVAACAGFAVCAVGLPCAGPGRGAAAPSPVASPVAFPAACREAAWPYVPAECGGHAPRPVRVLRADLGR